MDQHGVRFSFWAGITEITVFMDYTDYNRIIAAGRSYWSVPEDKLEAWIFQLATYHPTCNMSIEKLLDILEKRVTVWTL